MPQSQAATKADLKNLEKSLDAKNDKIDTKTGVLAHAIFKLDQRLEMNRIEAKNDVQRVLEHIDAFAGKIQDYARKAVVQDYRFNQLEPQVQDHEKRISAMENPKLGGL